LATWAQRSEDANFVAVHVQQVVVDSEKADEGDELEDGLHSQSASWAEILATWAQRSEDANFVAVHVQEVVVNGEQADEGEKERGGREEMPHVVVVKEIHPVARLVQISKTKQKKY
jgi:hypothetical protein